MPQKLKPPLSNLYVYHIKSNNKLLEYIYTLWNSPIRFSLSCLSHLRQALNTTSSLSTFKSSSVMTSINLFCARSMNSSYVTTLLKLWSMNLKAAFFNSSQSWESAKLSIPMPLIQNAAISLRMPRSKWNLIADQLFRRYTFN